MSWQLSFTFLVSFTFYNSLTLSWRLSASTQVGKLINNDSRVQRETPSSEIQQWKPKYNNNSACFNVLSRVKAFLRPQLSVCTQGKRLEVQLQAITKQAVSSLKCCFGFLFFLWMHSEEWSEIYIRRRADPAFDFSDRNWTLVSINFWFRLEIMIPLAYIEGFWLKGCLHAHRHTSTPSPLHWLAVLSLNILCFAMLVGEETQASVQAFTDGRETFSSPESLRPTSKPCK